MWKTPKKKLNDRKILIIQRPLPFRRPSRHLFQTFQTTSRHHQEAFQTPSIFLPDTFKTNSRILSDIWWTQFRGLIDTFRTPKRHSLAVWIALIGCGRWVKLPKSHFKTYFFLQILVGYLSVILPISKNSFQGQVCRSFLGARAPLGLAMGVTVSVSHKKVSKFQDFPSYD